MLGKGQAQKHTYTAVHPASIFFIAKRRLRPGRKQQEPLNDFNTLVAASKCPNAKLVRRRHDFRVKLWFLGVEFGCDSANTREEEGRARSD